VTISNKLLKLAVQVVEKVNTTLLSAIQIKQTKGTISLKTSEQNTLEMPDLTSSKNKVTTAKETTFKNIEVMRHHLTLTMRAVLSMTRETTRITTRVTHTTTDENPGIMNVLKKIVGLVLAIGEIDS